MDLLWTDFLNSDWHDWRGTGQSGDRLDKPEWVARFLRTWSLVAPVPPSPADLEALRGLRTKLQHLARAAAGGAAPTPEDLQELNRILAGGPVIRRVEAAADGARVALHPQREDWAQVMAEVAASFARTLTEGEPARVRICENPDCLWFFYDDTRNRTKRYCEDKTCGNLMKVRRFRARQKAGE